MSSMRATSSSNTNTTTLVLEYCEQMMKDHPDRASFYEEIMHCYKEKLWHPFTIQVLQFLETTPNQIPFYETITTSNSNNALDALAVARMAVCTAHGIVPPDFEAQRQIMENALEKTKQQQQQQNNNNNNINYWPAIIYLQSQHAILLLTNTTTTNDQHNHGEILEILEQDLLQPEYPKMVHAAHYQAAMEYYKRYGPAQSYYENAMRFLNYDPQCQTLLRLYQKEEEPHHHPAIRVAIDLILAALTGENIYDLTNVFQQPILNVLVTQQQQQDDDHSYVVSLLEAVTQGNIVALEQWWNQYQQPYYQQQQQPSSTTLGIIFQNKTIIHEKCTLTALVHLISSKHPHERNISFTEIAQACKSSNLADVEWMLMRACSVQLIQATIDQTQQIVHVSFVQPRTQLNTQQMQQLAQAFHTWTQSVQQHTQFTKNQTVMTTTTTTTVTK